MKRYYAFDRGIFQPQALENVAIHTNPVEKDREHSPMFTEGYFAQPSLPWEVRYDNAYPNVIYDEEAQLYRLYYTLIIYDPESSRYTRQERAKRNYIPKHDRRTATGYAESKDGIHWTKPNLGIVEFQGSKDNNLIMLSAHGTGVMLDKEELNPKRRYKMMLMLDVVGVESRMAVSFSADGIHWEEPIVWPKYTARGDSHNFVFRDRRDGKYKVITRIWRNNLRLSALSESTDFINWSEPKEILRGWGWESQVYSMPVFPMGDMYLGLASMFHEGDRTAPDFDTVDCELTYATKLDVFDFVDPGVSFIPRGEGHYPDGEFDCCCIYSAAPVEIDGKLCFYYMGGNGQHTNYRETSFGRAFLEKDKFAYMSQRNPENPGKLVSAAVHFFGDTFRILCDKEPEGSLEIQLVSSWTEEQGLEGYTFRDCRMTKEPDGWYRVTFAKALGDFPPEQKVSIVARLKGCKVYAMEGDFAATSINY